MCELGFCERTKECFRKRENDGRLQQGNRIYSGRVGEEKRKNRKGGKR